MTQRVSLIGLGSMGAAMATKLLEQGFSVDIWNRSPKNMDELAAKGARMVSLANALGNPVVISMLSNDAAALETFSSENLSKAEAEVVHVNMATLSPEASRELAERHEAAGLGYVSAPVLGRPIAILNGRLLVVAAGKPEHIAAAIPVIEKVSARHWVLGEDHGAATLVKLGVNYNLIHALQAIAESVALVEAGGVDANTFIEIITHTAFTGSAYAGYGPMIANKNFTPPGFTMDLGLKDVKLVEDAATNLGLHLPVAGVLRGLFEEALTKPELRELDWSAVSELTRKPRS
mgnify:CR=1 FL=1